MNRSAFAPALFSFFVLSCATVPIESHTTLHEAPDPEGAEASFLLRPPIVGEPMAAQYAEPQLAEAGFAVRLPDRFALSAPSLSAPSVPAVASAGLPAATVRSASAGHMHSDGYSDGVTFDEHADSSIVTRLPSLEPEARSDGRVVAAPRSAPATAVAESPTQRVAVVSAPAEAPRPGVPAETPPPSPVSSAHEDISGTVVPAAQQRPVVASAPVATTHSSEPRSVGPDSIVEVSGMEAEVRLAGSGWIYVGSEYAAGSVELIGKSREEGDDLFLFELSRPGEYGLWFQQQHAETGTFDNRRVTVVSSSDVASSNVADHSSAASVSFAPARTDLGFGGDEAQESTRPAADYSLAIRLLQSGSVTDAFRTLLDVSSAHDPFFSELPEEYVEEFADASTAISSPLREQFWAGITRLRPEDEDDVDGELLEPALRRSSRSEIPDAQAVVAVAELPALSVQSAGYENELDDEALFLIARRIESPGPERDLREALRLYRLITSRFPLSPHWDASRRRAEHIERHYIDIR